MTIKDAECNALDAVDVFEEVSFPNIYYRADFCDCDFSNSPAKRFEALECAKLI